MSDHAPTTTDSDGLVGIDPEEADLEVSERIIEDGIDWVSKSRVKEFKQCPRSFYFKYLTENRGPPNYYTERGTEVHEVFERFHENLLSYIDRHGTRPQRFSDLMPADWQLWGQWLDQYIGNFWQFEERRWQAVEDFGFPGREIGLDLWKPLGVEVEGWLGEPPADYDGDPDHVAGEPPVGDAPWMGKADAILASPSVPGVEGRGVTILDYKTGSVPNERYRDDGIYLEGEFYAMIFEQFYDVDAVAGYYPGDDELIVSPAPDKDRRFTIKDVVLGMQKDPTEMGNFPVEEQPLCHYGDGKCLYYDICPSRWNEDEDDGQTGDYR